MSDTGTLVQPSARPPILAITGPTACGKSALAIRIAETFDGVVINADSMQVYGDLRILSARPTPEEEARVPHRLFGVLPASRDCSAEQWRTLAVREIEAALALGKLPILVGGTGLYLRVLQRGLAAVPEIPEAVRAAVRQRQRTLDPQALHGELALRDPEMAARLKPADGQRIARALEVVEATGRSLADYQRMQTTVAADYDALAIAALPPRAALNARIEARLEKMLEEGALDEVRALLDQGLDPALPAMRAVGVPELASYLYGERTRAQALAAAQAATRRYAKRQRTWLRHQTPRDFDKAAMLYAQFSESLDPVIFNEIRWFLLTAQP